MDIKYEDDVQPIPGVVVIAEDNASSTAQKCLEGFMYSDINSENYKQVGGRSEFEELIKGLSEAEKRDVYVAMLRKSAFAKKLKPELYPYYYVAVEYFKMWYFQNIVIKGGNETRLPLTNSEIQKARKAARAERDIRIEGGIFHIAPRESIDNKVA